MADSSERPDESLFERSHAWVHETFPHRQIYIRRDGRVTFFTFGPGLQATLAILTLIFLGWVAFATVNVIFSDRIRFAKEHRYAELQSAYENRVADLQTGYDRMRNTLGISLYLQNQAVACARKDCDVAVLQRLDAAIGVQQKSLQRMGISQTIRPLRETPPPKPIRKTRPHIEQWSIEKAVKPMLDKAYALYSGKAGATVSSDTAFQLIYGMIWTAFWGFLVVVATALVRLLIRTTRRERSADEI